MRTGSDPSAGRLQPTLLPGPVTLTWWHAGGLHAHVRYPDGSWEHRTWKASDYWEVDALAYDLKSRYESVDVKP